MNIQFQNGKKILAAIRDLSLAIFLGIVGLRYGTNQSIHLQKTDFTSLLTSFVTAITAILVGFFMERYIFRMNWIIFAWGICGSIPSTTGLGAAIDATESEEVITRYGALHPFALMGMTIIIILLTNISL